LCGVGARWGCRLCGGKMEKETGETRFGLRIPGITREGQQARRMVRAPARRGVLAEGRPLVKKNPKVGGTVLEPQSSLRPTKKK